MIEIQFGPKVSSIFNDANPNMIFHIGSKNSVVFKATPRTGISTTKRSKGYYFTANVKRNGHTTVVVLDGDAAQAWRNCFGDLTNLVVQTGSEGRGNLDIVQGNNIFTTLLEPIGILADTPDTAEQVKVRKQRETIRVINIEDDQQTLAQSLAHCSLLYGTLWINNPRLGFCGYHNVFVLVQKTTKSTQYLAFHPNNFAVFSLGVIDLTGNRFREQSFDCNSQYAKILSRYQQTLQGSSEVIETILKLLKLRAQDQYSLETTELQLNENSDSKMSLEETVE